MQQIKKIKFTKEELKELFGQILDYVVNLLNDVLMLFDPLIENLIQDNDNISITFIGNFATF